ncbi:MAG: hypothetical protein M0Q14_11380 [Tissierellaceae bacterium]|nr:hypothetical protein [Tissierellaceae bacterium]
MKDMTRRSFIKLINLVILLIPMSFLFHYIETSLFTNGSMFAFLGTILYIVSAGIISVKTKSNFIILISILSNLLSVVLGKMFIISPNESWFKPFGMNFAIIFTGLIILIGISTVRLLASRIFK